MTACFDWYQATIEGFPEDIGTALMEMPGAVKIEHGRGRQNYRHGSRVLTADGDTLATVLHGGLNGAPNAFGTGVNAAPFASIIRRTWPDAHRVSRLDSAVDVRTDFAGMHAACRAIAADLGIKGRSIVPDDAAEGATYYMGAEASRIRFRLYEKGKLLAKQGVEDADPGIVRFEVQLRPDRASRTTAAHLAPGEAWGATGWVRRIASELLLMNPDRVVMQHRMRTTFEATHAAMLMQYGPHLMELRNRAASWETVGLDLGSALDGTTPADL